MVTNELLSYVSAQKAQGIDPTLIKEKLRQNGWKESDITQAFDNLNPDLHTTTSPTDPINEKPKGMFDFQHMQWYELIALLPALYLVFTGGIIDIIFGLIGGSICLKIIQQKSSFKVKALKVIIVTVLYYAADFIAGIIFIALLMDLMT